MNIFERIQQIRDISGSDEITRYYENRPAVGYFCSYIPEEVIHAAGLVPYRMRATGSRGTHQGDIYFSSLNCSFVRNCFDKALRKDFSFLSGVVFLNGCDHTRRVYDNWRHAELPPAFLYMFAAPHVINDLALEHFTHEIKNFAGALEKNFGCTINENTLAASIELYNQKRKLLMEIYELRKNKRVPIKAGEFLTLLMAVTALPVETSIELCGEVLSACKDRCVNTPDDIRLFVSSGCMEEPEHLESIEKSGAVIVADSLCLGRRHFDTPVKTGTDPWQALAERYLSHLSCPRMMNDFQRRLSFLSDSMEEYHVDAVIIEKLKFCDLWGGEIFLVKQESMKKNFPLLTLERELFGEDAGQVKTRIQAFIEQVRNTIQRGYDEQN